MHVLQIACCILTIAFCIYLYTHATYTAHIQNHPRICCIREHVHIDMHVHIHITSTYAYAYRYTCIYIYMHILHHTCYIIQYACMHAHSRIHKSTYKCRLNSPCSRNVSQNMVYFTISYYVICIACTILYDTSPYCAIPC